MTFLGSRELAKPNAFAGITFPPTGATTDGKYTIWKINGTGFILNS